MKKIFLLLLIFILPFISADDTGFNLALENQDLPTGDSAWTNDANSLVLSNAFSTSSLTGANQITNILYFKNFSSSVPDGATIDGIEVQIMVSTNSGSLVFCNMMNLTKAESPVGDNKCEDESISLTITFTNYTLGGPTDLWGTTWTAAEINSDGFGVQNGYSKPSGTMSTRAAQLSFLRVKVYFTPVTDPIFPTFTNIVDNEGSFTDTGTFVGNVTITDTNGTAGMTFDGVNYTADNVSDFYNVSFPVTTFGTFNYFWWALGNGSEQNYNQSSIQTYTVPEAGEVNIFEWGGWLPGDVWRSIVNGTNKFKVNFDADIFGLRDLDIFGTSVFRDNVTITDFIGQSKFVISDTSTGQLSTAEITTGDLPSSAFDTFNATYDAKNSSRWVLFNGNISHNDGRVGINTTTPLALLHINGEDTLSPTPTTGVRQFITTATSYASEFAGTGDFTGIMITNSKSDGSGVPFFQLYNSINTDLWSFTVQENGRFDIRNGTVLGTEVFTILQGGNVGIGTATPTHELNVVGDVNITGNTSSSWFNGNFNWTTLTDWLSFNGAVLSFNETKLNETILDVASVYNNTDEILWFDNGNVTLKNLSKHTEIGNLTVNNYIRGKINDSRIIFHASGQIEDRVVIG